MSQTNWNNTLLDKMRQIGDPAADKAANILWKNQDRPIMDDLVYISKNHDQPISEIMSHLGIQASLTEEEVQDIATYFQETENIEQDFTAEDYEHFKLNAEVFESYGYFITFLLFFKSLPTGYMCPNPAFVLHNTKLLENFAARRVMETAQFIFAVNRPDWYKTHSAGLEAIQKVRLMHAGMRVALIRGYKSRPPWDNEKYGKPINQEDVTLTNHLFSFAIIHGLDSIGTHLLEKERHAVFHTWQRIGQALGISPDLYATNYDDGYKQYRTIFERGKSVNNPSGPPLTHALLSAMNTIMESEIDMKVLEDITLYLLNDPDTADSLGLHQPTFFDKVIGRFLHFILRRKIWHYFFHHKRTNFLSRWVNKMANKIIIRNFNLQGYEKKYPGSSPLEAFTKSVLSELSKRDMRSFEEMSEEERQKSFFQDSELYYAWDLGSFNMTNEATVERTV